MPAQLRNLASLVFAESHEMFEDSLRLYETVPGAPAFWMMCDLRSSAKFRIAAGERAAFTRALGFVRLCRRLAGMHHDVRVFKELGDAVLIRATDPRELLELLVLLDLVGSYAGVDDARDPEWPSLAMRSAITFGRAFQVDTDYLGQALDRLARISGIKSESLNALATIDVPAAKQLEGLLDEYPFLTLSNSRLVPPDILKLGEPKFRVHELVVDRAEAAKTRDFFSNARAALSSVASEPTRL